MTVTYLAARVPQLIKNYRRNTAEGLSLFMFVLLVLGSITYVLSIFVRSVYVGSGMSWCRLKTGKTKACDVLLEELLTVSYVDT